MIRRQILTGLRMTIVLVLLLGIGYPVVITAVVQATMRDRANGSFVSARGHVVGSKLLGVSFVDAKGVAIAKYFQSRPSAAGSAGYDAMSSGGSNLGPSNPDLLTSIAARATAYRALNGLGRDTQVPVDAVTASASGLDPDISVANARLQAPRVASARHLALATVLGLVRSHTTERALGFMGEAGVNVLELNLALDALRS